LQRKEMSAREVMNASLARIHALEPVLRAFITLRPDEELLREADQVDARRVSGEVGALAGLPIAVKDSICTAGLRTTCGSRMLENFLPPYDATVVERIKRADGIILGKTNMDEFCMGSSTENSAFYPTLNPVNPEYVPGGTSGGSAAAVAAGFAPLALGSDTGGSVRQPAAFCGVVGMKPTYGRASRYGLIAYASSFDQIGVLANTTSDAALLLSVITGHDPHDSTSAALPSVSVPDSQGERRFTFGVPKLSRSGMDPEVSEALARTVARLVEGGHRQVTIDLLDSNLLLACYYVIASAEASSNLARYDGSRFGPVLEAETYAELTRRVRSAGFGEEVKRRIMLGTFVLSAGYYDDYYGRAIAIRAQLIRQMRAAFAQCDAIIQPIAPSAAFKLGQKTADPFQMYLADLYSVAANVAGVPAIALPCGRAASGLPLSVQFMAPWNEDERLILVARELERLLELDGSAGDHGGS